MPTVVPPAATAIQAATPASAYPAPAAADVPTVAAGAYPGPVDPTPTGAAAAPTALVIPAPSAGQAVITGQLITADGQPRLATLYLGQTLYAENQPQIAPLISFSPQTDPEAVQETATGKFLFMQVPPGTYGLVLWNPAGSTIANDPKSGDTLLVTVTAGQSLDLGQVVVPAP